MNPVVFFQMPARDKQRMRDFYEKVFGWKTHQTGADMGEYVVVTTTETDEKTMMPKSPGKINGGFYQMPEDSVGQHPNIVIAVDDLEESMKKVTAGGGKIHGKPDDVAGTGKIVSIIDPEGNHVVLLQPNPM